MNITLLVTLWCLSLRTPYVPGGCGYLVPALAPDVLYCCTYVYCDVLVTRNVVRRTYSKQSFLGVHHTRILFELSLVGNTQMSALGRSIPTCKAQGVL